MHAKVLERRKFQRLPLSIPVFVRGIDEAGKEFLEFATALNISAGGVLLATRRSLPKSASVALEIPVAPLPPDSISTQSIRFRLEHGACRFFNTLLTITGDGSEQPATKSGNPLVDTLFWSTKKG